MQIAFSKIEHQSIRCIPTGVVNRGLKTNKYFIKNTRHHADVIVRDIELKEGIA